MKCKDTKSEISRLNKRIAELEKKQKQPVTIMGVFRFLIFAGAIELTWLAWNGLIWSWEWLNVPTITNSEFTIQHLLILGPFALLIISVSVASIAFCAWAKSGYCNLKGIEDEGLIKGLIKGLIVGLIGGLIVGLIVGLTMGLIVGLIGGLIKEFK